MNVARLLCMACLLVGCGARSSPDPLEAVDGGGGDAGGVDASPDVVVPTGCYDDPVMMTLPQDSESGYLATSDPTDSPRGAGHHRDAFEFGGAAETRVDIELVQASFDTYVYLLDAECRVVAQDDDGGVGLLSRVSYTLPRDGTYVIVVTSYTVEATGSYTIELSAEATPETELACADDRDNDADGHTDCADPDCASRPECAASIEQYCANGVDDDSDGAVDCEDPDCFSAPFCQAEPLDLCSDAAVFFGAPPWDVAGALSAWDPSSGPRGSGYYYDAYELTLTAGQAVMIETVEGDFDTYLYLMDAGCSEVTHNDDGGSGLLSRISYTAPSAGTYFVVVTSFSSGTTGDYLLDVTTTPTEPPPPNHCFSAVEGQLYSFQEVQGTLSASDLSNGPRGDGYYFDAWEVTGGANTTLWIEILDASFDTYLYLLDQNCEEIARDDDGGPDLLSLIETPTSYAGTYTVVVTSYSPGTTGRYVIMVDT